MRTATSSVPRTKIAGAELYRGAALAALFAALTGLGAIMRVPLRPVPVTMQVFFVLLTGLSLGPSWAFASMILYLLAGISGAPFFASPPHSGPQVLLGPTGGYLVGFALAAYVTGLVHRSLLSRPGPGYARALAAALLASVAGIAVIYACGWSWLSAWLKLHGADPAAAFRLGVKPFIAIDLGKALLAALAVHGVPRKLKSTRPSRDTEAGR
ncbi:MAG: biotin transporter BioY [Candidatus Geothermincolales bacterium]